MLPTSIAISLIAVLLSVWMGRRNPVRSSGVTSGMLVLLMCCPLLLILPKIEVSWLNSTNEVITGTATTQSSGISILQILSLIWIAGSIILSLRLLFQSYSIRRWCREAETTPSARDLRIIEECAEQLNLNYQRIPEIRYTSKLTSPVITGLVKPVLLLPRTSTTWSRDTLRMVIMHELGHLQRRDLWTNMAAHIACAIHWFNPLVWILRKRLSNECEYACDAHVIAHGADTKRYIHALCDVAESCNNNLTPTTALAMANTASLKARVSNVLHGQPKNSRWIVIGILALSATATIAYTVVRPQRAFTPAAATEQPAKEAPNYTPEEINKRLNANPFPSE